MALEKRTNNPDNKPNTWRIRVTYKKKSYTDTFYGNKKEAKQFEEDFIYRIKKGLIGSNENSLFKDFWEQYKKDYLYKLKAATRDQYMNVYDTHLYPFFGEYKLCDINPLLINQFVNKLSTSISENTEKEYSVNTINCICWVLRAILNKAEKWEVINRSPYRNIDVPKKIKTNTQKLTLEQIKVLINAYENETVPAQKCGFFLAITTGMRTSEIRALTVNDIDFDNKTIQINKQIGNHLDEKDLNINVKNETSDRIIHVSDMTLHYLKEYIDGIHTWNKDKQLFFKNGRIVSQPYFRIHLTRKLKELGLPHICFHDLRHTAATLLIKNKVDISTVSNLLGHSNTTTTLNVYVDPLEEYAKQAANKMDTIFTQLKD